MPIHITPMLDELVSQELFEMPSDVAQPLDSVEHVASQVKPIELIEYRHIKGRGGRALFLVTSNMEIRVVGSSVCEAVNEPRIAVEGEDHRLIGREDGIEIPIGKAVRMLGEWLQCHEIDDIHDPYSQIREMSSQ